MNIPDNLKYTKDHEWIKVDGDEALIGITEFAQKELGDIVFIEVETEGHGPLKMQNSFPRFSKTQGGVRRTAPVTPGQHNLEVMRELLGWDAEKLEAKVGQGLM